jgi:parvulin-like peptidyl-prolyl isomerase
MRLHKLFLLVFIAYCFSNAYGQEQNPTGYSRKMALKKAKELSNRIHQGEDFSVLAKQYSMDVASARLGGDLGIAKIGKMLPSFEKAVLDLEPDQVSKPVKSEYGYHLIQLVEKNETHFRARHILIRTR